MHNSSSSFHVKLRPLTAEFLKYYFSLIYFRKLHSDKKWEVYYYTAGIRQYGIMILDIFKMELKKKYTSEVEGMKDMFSHEKLIGRDDHKRFESTHDMTEEEKFD